MKSVNVVRKESDSKLVAAVDNCLNAAHFAPQQDVKSSFYAIPGMSGSKYRFFINTLVKSLGNTSYLEVGSWAGSTLCSAIHGNKVRAVAIDNWSEFGGPKDAFMNHLQMFKTPEADVNFIESDFRAVDYSKLGGQFDIYMFDGPHLEADQYDGLMLAMPALKDEFVFIVDDWNWERVRHGTKAAIAKTGLDVKYAAEIRTSLIEEDCTQGFGESDWHNGYYISVLAKR